MRGRRVGRGTIGQARTHTSKAAAGTNEDCFFSLFFIIYLQRCSAAALLGSGGGQEQHEASEERGAERERRRDMGNLKKVADASFHPPSFQCFSWRAGAEKKGSQQQPPGKNGLGNCQ